MKHNLGDRLERVPCLNTDDYCLGCVFQDRSNGTCRAREYEHPVDGTYRDHCRAYKRHEDGSRTFSDWIFIRRTPAARAAYVALVLEHGKRGGQE